MTGIKVGGETYPARITNAALVAFKHRMGYDHCKEPEKLDSEGLAVLAYESARSTCRVDGVEFCIPFEEFCDLTTPMDLNAWVFNGEGEGDESKKKGSL